jgi:hypothetical protein
VRYDRECENYATPKEYFLDGGVMAWRYVPKTRRSEERWRAKSTHPSYEISAVLLRRKMLQESYLTIEERLTRWGIVMHTVPIIEKFQHEYADRSEEWTRILLVLDVCEKDIQTALDFTNGMHLLDLVDELIPSEFWKS